MLMNSNKSRNSIVMICFPFYLIFTFFDLAVEVYRVHRGSDDVGVAVPGCHDACNLIHQLHGHTCVVTHTHTQS